eukprot:COSAG01_NODE_29889_length_627_cov_1.259470_1_plen_37_part_10
MLLGADQGHDGEALPSSPPLLLDDLRAKCGLLGRAAQ